VAASIYDACHYFRLFQNTSFGPYCGIITSYEPNHNAISREPPNSDERYKFDTYTQHVLKNGQTTKQYEDEAKRRFIEEPANLKLLIVVSKLLTGFDAPSCTYIYLDNELRDHNLFQAICRTNRLDGDDKDYGHIVDFKELFGDVQEAIAVYSSDELDIDEGGDADNNVHLKDWLAKARQGARRGARGAALPVRAGAAAARGGAVPALLLRRRRQPECAERDRAAAGVVLQGGGAVSCAPSPLAQNLTEAGYTDAEAARCARRSSSTPRCAPPSRSTRARSWTSSPTRRTCATSSTPTSRPTRRDLGELGELSLTELIVETGIHDAIAKAQREGQAVEERHRRGIINNVRKTIIRDQLTDPRFYEQMSQLLDDLIQQSRADAAAYEEFLKQGRGAGEAAGRQAARRGHSRGAAWQA
jgi:type I restriction enzyme R subunit